MLKQRGIVPINPDEFISSSYNPLLNYKTITLEKDATVADALSIFVNDYCNLIPILSDGELIGVVTKKEMLKFIHENKSDSLDKISITDIMKLRRNLPLTEINAKRQIEINEKSEFETLFIKKNGKFIGCSSYYELLEMIKSMRINISNFPILREYMGEDFIYVSKNLYLSELVELFVKKNKEFAIVGNKKQQFGIIAKKDILSAVFAGCTLEKTHVENIMSPTLILLAPGDDLSFSVPILLERKFNQIPLKSDRGIEGFVTLKSITLGYYRLLSKLKEKN